MSSIAVLVSSVFLILALFFCLGWILPLVIGLVRRRKGKSSAALIVLGGVWGGISVLGLGLLSIAVILYMNTVGRWDVTDFDPSSYEGNTAVVMVPAQGKAEMTAAMGDGSTSYRFSSERGEFVVPAEKLDVYSFSLSRQDAEGKQWQLSWWFNDDYQLDPSAAGPVSIDKGPPLTVRVKRRELPDGAQKIEMETLDSRGMKVSLDAPHNPVIQIIDESGAVIWSHKMEHG